MSTTNAPRPESASSSPLAAALRSMFRQPAFLAAAGVMLVAAVSLNAATQYMQLHFQKLPVPLAKELDTVPTKLGPWVQVSKDMPLQSDVEHELGTKQYIYRDYVDERAVPPSRIRDFENKSVEERRRLLAYIQREYPRAVIHMGVTYYTGMVDTVAHIPDRCYIADGYVPRDGVDIDTWRVFPQRENPNLQLRFITFEDQTLAGRETRNVAYFFHANGSYQADPLGVRLQLQNLFQMYGYYSKVELMSVTSDGDQARAAMTDFLSNAMPAIEQCWPDWQQVIGASNAENATASAKQ